MIVSGLYGSIVSPVFSCSANSCTWPRAATLGICASCHNITATKDLEGSITCDNYSRYGGGWTSVNTNVSGSTYSFLEVEDEVKSTLLNLTVYTRHGLDSAADITECHLEWCAMTYDNASVANTKLSLPLQETYPLRYMGNYSDGDEGESNIFEAGDGFPAGFNATFTVSYANAVELYDFFVLVMDASTQCVEAIPDDERTDSATFSLGSAVLSHPSVKDMVLSMAASMTDAIRSLAGTHAVGTAWQSVQYTNVYWQWLVLPAVVTSLSAVLLGITIVQNRVSQAVIWKSSALALLFHPLTGWDERDVDASSPKTMKKAARGMRGQLKDHEDQGLRIVRTGEACS